MELLIHQIFTNNLGIIKKTPKVVIKTKKKQIDKWNKTNTLKITSHCAIQINTGGKNFLS